ncbi:unnamed protein product, partial [marine sediment metagenome]
YTSDHSCCGTHAFKRSPDFFPTSRADREEQFKIFPSKEHEIIYIETMLDRKFSDKRVFGYTIAVHNNFNLAFLRKLPEICRQPICHIYRRCDEATPRQSSTLPNARFRFELGSD